MRRISSQLNLKDYRSAIQLDQIYEWNYFHSLTDEERMEIIGILVNQLADESNIILNGERNVTYLEKRQLLRALLNVRAPKPLKFSLLQPLNRLLQAETYEKEIIKASSLKPVSETIPCTHVENMDKVVLWQGDITHLEIDAIVNAANNQMLGCFEPLHLCIDNAIHSAAGPQLREDCQTIMRIQGERERTGEAKITRAYNLPSKFVLHTVGPIVPQGKMVNAKQQEELASCYISCLELASQVEDIKYIAFCAISTGVFGFPKKEAAEIAVNVVNEWLANHPNRFERIIYCVFSEEDYSEYVRAFQGK